MNIFLGELTMTKHFAWLATAGLMLGAAGVAIRAADAVKDAPAPKTAVAAEPAHAEPEPPKEAVCVLVPTGTNKVSGTLLLTQGDGFVEVTGTVEGLTPGEHGFHIHEFGDLRDSKEGKSAGGHFNPGGHMHGGPEGHEHHAGDLGNIKADDSGKATVKAKAEGVHLHFIIGRSLVVHGGVDDLKSQPAGNSGPRVAVGVIGIAEVKKAPAPTK